MHDQELNRRTGNLPYDSLQRHFGSVILILALLLSIVFTAPAHANPKYAAIVIDADYNRVLHEANADAIRHPASLTKMMTLYMTFEALRKGQISLKTRLRASKHAASMPQTNIGMKRGDTLTVEQAIRALIVRSANDVAVVLAEKLAKTEWQFAVNMTQKAKRDLGMKRTVFRNANGLPDRRQVTTARDMAKLSIALRDDFPQYYHFFKATQFSYKGKTYKSHNKVLKQVKGVDGLKTGYVRMSGFNLASSIRKNGYSLVAIVLGGKTSKRRDAHMKDLLSRSMVQIAKMRKPRKSMMFAKTVVPSPKLKPGTEAPLTVAQAATAASPEAPQLALVSSARAAEPIKLAYAAPSAKPSPPAAKRSHSGVWGIQVGAYKQSKDAFIAAMHAVDLAENELKGSEITVSDPADGAGQVFRARIDNLSERQARNACRLLLKHKESCFVYHGNAL